MNNNKGSELALILKNSNIKEVSDLANEFLALEAAYGELKQNYVRLTSEVIMRRHETLFKRLAEQEKREREANDGTGGSSE